MLNGGGDISVYQGNQCNFIRMANSCYMAGHADKANIF